MDGSAFDLSFLDPSGRSAFFPEFRSPRPGSLHRYLQTDQEVRSQPESEAFFLPHPVIRQTVEFARKGVDYPIHSGRMLESQMVPCNSPSGESWIRFGSCWRGNTLLLARCLAPLLHSDQNSLCCNGWLKSQSCLKKSSWRSIYATASVRRPLWRWQMERRPFRSLSRTVTTDQAAGERKLPDFEGRLRKIYGDKLIPGPNPVLAERDEYRW